MQIIPFRNNGGDFEDDYYVQLIQVFKSMLEKLNLNPVIKPAICKYLLFTFLPVLNVIFHLNISIGFFPCYRAFNPFPNKSCVLYVSAVQAFKNFLGEKKGENACREHFLLFPLCNLENFPPFSLNFHLSFANFHFEKVLILLF